MVRAQYQTLQDRRNPIDACPKQKNIFKGWCRDPAEIRVHIHFQTRLAIVVQRGDPKPSVAVPFIDPFFDGFLRQLQPQKELNRGAVFFDFKAVKADAIFQAACGTVD